MEPRHRDQVIILPDIGQGTLLGLHGSELESLKTIVRVTTRILWATMGGLLSGQKPEHGMVLGLARCLRSENASLDLITLDFNPASSSLEQVKDTITMFADEQAKADHALDSEYLSHNGAIFVNRLAPFNEINETYAPSRDHMRTVTLKENNNVRAIAHCGKRLFQCSGENLDVPEDTQVTVKVSYLGSSELVGLDAPPLEVETDPVSEWL